MAMRLAVLVIQHFELLEKNCADVVRFGYKNYMQLDDINDDFYDFIDMFWLEAASSKKNVTELLKFYLKSLGGEKAFFSETVLGKKAEAYISACKESREAYLVFLRSVENKEENLGRELGDNPAPADAVVQKKQNVLVRRKGKKEENNPYVIVAVNIVIKQVIIFILYLFSC